MVKIQFSLYFFICISNHSHGDSYYVVDDVKTTPLQYTDVYFHYLQLLANMLNFLLCTEQDRKEAAALERRRQAEEERKKRIFNPRVRLIGVSCLHTSSSYRKFIIEESFIYCKLLINCII